MRSPLYGSGGYSSFDEFENAILAGCGVVKAADEARDLLRKISQGEKSVAAYAAEFGPLADALPNRHVDDLADDFTRGLALSLQTALALSKIPKGTHWHTFRDTALDLERPGNRGKTPRPALFPEPDMMDLNAVASFGNRPPPPPHRSAPARPGSSSGPRLDQMSAQELKEILKRYRGCFKCGLMFADHTKGNCPGQQHPALLQLEVVDDGSEFEFLAANSITLASTTVVRADSLGRVDHEPVQLLATFDPNDEDTRVLNDEVDDRTWSALRPVSFRHLDIPVKLLIQIYENLRDMWYPSSMMPDDIKRLFVVGDPMFPLPAFWRVGEDTYGAPRFLTWYKDDQIELADIKGIIPRSLIQTADIRNPVDGGMMATRLFFSAPHVLLPSPRTKAPLSGPQVGVSVVVRPNDSCSTCTAFPTSARIAPMWIPGAHGMERRRSLISRPNA